jgi:hypothetical protein
MMNHKPPCLFRGSPDLLFCSEVTPATARLSISSSSPPLPSPLSFPFSLSFSLPLDPSLPCFSFRNRPVLTRNSASPRLRSSLDGTIKFDRPTTAPKNFYRRPNAEGGAIEIPRVSSRFMFLAPCLLFFSPLSSPLLSSRLLSFPLPSSLLSSKHTQQAQNRPRIA